MERAGANVVRMCKRRGRGGDPSPIHRLTEVQPRSDAELLFSFDLLAMGIVVVAVRRGKEV
jgi:hypothetical protein